MVRKDLFSLVFPLAFAACSSTSAATPEAPATQTVESLFAASISRLATAWNAGDGDAWAAEFWADGSLINILGVVFPNAGAVAGVTNQILAGPFKGSVFTPVIRRVRYLGTAAVIDTDVSVTQFRALPPGATATQPGLLLTRLTHVFEERNGIWKITASQNTAVVTPP